MVRDVASRSIEELTNEEEIKLDGISEKILQKKALQICLKDILRRMGIVENVYYIEWKAFISHCNASARRFLISMIIE